MDPGGPASARPLQATRFFRFHILIFQNVATSDLGAPLRGRRPPSGNPGSATGLTKHQGIGSIRFWRQYVSLFVSIAAIVSLLVTSDRKSSCCDTNHVFTLTLTLDMKFAIWMYTSKL